MLARGALLNISGSEAYGLLFKGGLGTREGGFRVKEEPVEGRRGEEEESEFRRSSVSDQS